MSNLQTAFDQLGFAGEQKTSLLKLFKMAGYLEPEKLWQDLSHVPSIRNPKEVFLSVLKILLKAEESGQALSASDLDDAILSVDQWEDLLLYIAQNAFNRAPGQERNELKGQSWMEVYKDDYKQEAKVLGLIDRKSPALEEYDEAWIAGASRPGALARIQDYKYYLDNGIRVKGEVSMLAGQRELWADIDGMTEAVKNALSTQEIVDIDKVYTSVPAGKYPDAIEEGKSYLLYLAEKNDIHLATPPFAEYKQGESIPQGRFAGRTYANYAESETRKLTESLMSQDLINTYLQKIQVIDTAGIEGKRPDTFGTAIDAAKSLTEKILSGNYSDQKEFFILFQSNNPYIERQSISTQRAVDKVLRETGLDKEGYSITIEGVGFSCKQDVVTIHSELGALMAEKWIRAHSDIPEKDLPSHLKDLLFQHRSKDICTDPMPEVNPAESEPDLLGGVDTSVVADFL